MYTIADDFSRAAAQGAQGRMPQNLDISRWLWTIALFVSMRPFTLLLTGINPNTLNAQGGKPYDFYLLVVVAIACVPSIISRYRQFSKILFSNPLLISFFLLGALSTTWSIEPYLTIRLSGMILCVMFIVVAAAASCDPDEFVRRLLFALLLSVGLSIVFALFVPSFGLQRADFTGHFSKWRGIYAQKNHLGMLAAFSAVACFACGPNLLKRSTWMLGLFASLLCVAMSRSGSGIVLTMFGMSMYWAIYRLQKFYRFVLVFLIIFVTPIMVSYGQDFLVFGTQLLGRDDSFTGRTSIWAAGMGLWAEHPILGQGLAAFSSPEVSSVFANAAVTAGHVAVWDPHNAFLFLGISLGIVGIGMLLLTAGLALFQAFKGGYNQASHRLAILFVLLWLVAGAVESAPFFPGGMIFTLGICAIVSAASPRVPARPSQSAPIAFSPPRPRARRRRATAPAL